MGMWTGFLREEPIGEPLDTQFLRYHVQTYVQEIPPS